MSRVLVVEDSQSQREMIGKLLQENGFEVMTVEDGVEAVEAVKRNKPDLIVLDIVMPRMNGYEVCRLLKADPLTQKNPDCHVFFQRRRVRPLLGAPPGSRCLYCQAFPAAGTGGYD